MIAKACAAVLAVLTLLALLVAVTAGALADTLDHLNPLSVAGTATSTATTNPIAHQAPALTISTHTNAGAHTAVVRGGSSPGSPDTAPDAQPGAAPRAGAASAAACPGSAPALADIPTGCWQLYRAAAASCPGLHWAVLAAIGRIESNHARSTAPGVTSGHSPKGAVGMMQLEPGTFRAVTARHPPPPGGAQPPNPYVPHDAVYAAAGYLCDSGARGGHDLPRAVMAYNHSAVYVARVLALARRYATTPPTHTGRPSRPAPSTPRTPAQTPPAAGSPAAAAAIRYALAQRGKPYVWGGTGNPGYDCSGLTQQAYRAAGITLPRTAAQQYNAGPRLPANAPLTPGDLVYYGRPISHVALYLGAGNVVQAPLPGRTVEVVPLGRTGYAGATRPANRATSSSSSQPARSGPARSVTGVLVRHPRPAGRASGTGAEQRDPTTTVTVAAWCHAGCERRARGSARNPGLLRSWDAAPFGRAALTALRRSSRQTPDPPAAEGNRP